MNNPLPVKPGIAGRFRGFLPVVVDVETAGFNAMTDALLEIAAVVVEMDEANRFRVGETFSCHVEPFVGANLDPRALEFTGIDPYHPFRLAVPEHQALCRVLDPVNERVKATGCSRAILVGHNPFFDLGFLKAAVERSGFKRNPFHSFTTFDTATLSGLACGQTVLAKAVQAFNIEWDSSRAHSAAYDAEKTAELFCAILNRWEELNQP